MECLRGGIRRRRIDLQVRAELPAICQRADNQPRGLAFRIRPDLWICLPDGADKDVMTDGCVRFASLRDTTSEPTGFIFTASGQTVYVNLQHRGVNQGAL